MGLGNRQEAERWLRQAALDLEGAGTSLAGGRCEWAAFQAQQAAEKALKAFLTAQGRRATLTHSVIDLVRECGAYEADYLRLEAEEARELDRHYIASRYPNSYSTGIPADYYSQEIAQRCIKYAERILTKCRSTLSG